MFFCSNCNNIYDITKNINNINNDETLSDITSSSNINNDDVLTPLFKKIINNDTIDDNDAEIFKKLNLNSVVNNQYYKRLREKNKDLIMNTVKNYITPTTENIKINSAYHICTSCGNHQEIKAGTLITKKIYNKTSNNFTLIDDDRIKELATINYLPITRNYVCVNSKCPSVNNHELRSAKFYRIDDSFIVRYICLACKSSWLS